MKQIEWIKVIRDMSPRVHCITNYVTAGDVANMVLAIGGSPIMAQGIREVEDVTSICQSLVLNMGTLEEERVEAMILAGKKAVQLGHPVILDPVGVTASAFRRESALRILKAVRPSVIRGNASEIHMLEQVLSGAKTGNLCGVDAVPGRWMDLTAKAAASMDGTHYGQRVHAGWDNRGFLRIVRTCTGKDSGRRRREGSVRAQRGCSRMRRDAGGYNGSSCHGCVRPWPVRGTGCRKGNQDRRRNRKL